MSAIKKLAAAAALALCALAPSAAMAATVLYLSTAEWASAQDKTAACPSLSVSNYTAAHFIFGQFAETSTGSGVPDWGNESKRQSDGAIKSLEDAGATVLNYAGVLSPETQIGQASLFNGTTAGYPDKSGKWNEAMDKLDKLVAGDIVVVQTGYQIMDSTKAATIAQKIKDKKDLTFVLLLDTCQHCNINASSCKLEKNTDNLDAIKTNAIDTPNGWELKHRDLAWGTQVTNIKDPYNVSAYASTITAATSSGIPGKEVLQGNSTGAIMCAPKQNVIFQSATPRAGRSTQYKYTSDSQCTNGKCYHSGWYCLNSSEKDKPDACKLPGDTAGEYGSNWPELNLSSAYGMLIPSWQNNKGKGGACIYLGVDNNIFDHGRRSQHAIIGKMFVDLPKPSGACATPQSAAGAKGVCPGFQPGETCQLADAPTGTPDDQLAVLGSKDASGSPLCQPKVWVRVPPPAPAAAAPVPVNNPWALGLLGAAVAALAARRRRRE